MELSPTGNTMFTFLLLRAVKFFWTPAIRSMIWLFRVSFDFGVCLFRRGQGVFPAFIHGTHPAHTRHSQNFMQHNGGSGGGNTGGGVFGPRGRGVLGRPTVEQQVFGGGRGPGQEREHGGNANVNGMVDYDLIDSLLDFTAAEIEVEPLLFDNHAALGITQVEVTSSALLNVDGTPYIENGLEENSFQCDDIPGPELEWLSNFMDQCFSPQDINITTKPAVSDGSTSYSGKASEDADCRNTSDDDKQKCIITAANNLLANLQCQLTSPSSVLDRRSNKSQQVLVGVFESSSGGGVFESSSAGVVENGAPFCFTWPFKLLSPSSSNDTQSKDTTIPKPNQLFNSSANRGRVRGPRTKRPQNLCKRPLHDAEEMKLKKLKMVHSSPMGIPLTTTMPPTINPATTPATPALPTVNTPTPPPPTIHPPPVPLRLNDVSKRKCIHCEAQTTPQWRAGPRGPKTLCNACGVRYKSGRLFPEYRPSASPTYVESIHSNSHKKVVELRGKNSRDSQNTPVSAKGCELLYYIKSR